MSSSKEKKKSCMYVSKYIFKKDGQSSKQCYINKYKKKKKKEKTVKPCSFRAGGIHVVRGSFFALMGVGRLSRRECSP